MGGGGAALEIGILGGGWWAGAAWEPVLKSGLRGAGGDADARTATVPMKLVVMIGCRSFS